ncbi:MAG: helix-turn-helix domain-containing protein [Deltaproteobacteria bacterium]
MWSRSSQLGLSPYSEDGRLTASEVARLLDVHVNTVLLWCRRGYLSATRLGPRRRSGMWRIEWDTTRPLQLVSPRTGSTMRWLIARRQIVVRRPTAAAREAS